MVNNLGFWAKSFIFHGFGGSWLIKLYRATIFFLQGIAFGVCGILWFQQNFPIF